MNIIFNFVVLFEVLLSALVFVDSFQPLQFYPYQSSLGGHRFAPKWTTTPRWATPRYGPPITPPGSGKEEPKEQRQKDLIQLVEKVLSATDPTHIPSLLTKNIETILTIQQEQTAVELFESVMKATSSQYPEEDVIEAMDMILSFTENFVQTAHDMDDTNKKLLGKIIRTVADKELSERDREDQLDQLLAEERENFTPGFLRHLEGECHRIMNGPKISRESSRMIEILRVIQTRVLEEMGKDLGEGALVLGQLIAYEDKKERLAVLDAGLMVRGIEFAEELLSLTEEALEGFEKVPGGAEQDLIERVAGIHQRVENFIQQTQQASRNEFQ